MKMSKARLRTFFSSFGPGIVAGAADDDPSGIATYSIAGAQLGTSLLWTSLITWPLMAAVQMACARIGMVTGRGLAAALRKKFPRWVVATFSVALLAANTINIAADLAGMADAAELMSGRVNSHVFVVFFGVAIAWATVYFRYAHIARILKWLALFLFAYVIAAFHIGPDWRVVAHDAFVPSLPKTNLEWQTLVAILGTTISPYLFYWQASQEVEEEKAGGRLTVAQRKGATGSEILVRKFDVGIGTFFSNFVMFFIIVTTAFTLHRHGVTTIVTSREAAMALRPLAGEFASFLYTVGLLGVGFLAIPTLSGSAAYAFAETFGWRQGLDQKLFKARAFYGVIIVATALGIALDFAKVNPIRALFLSAVLNGLLAPVLLVGIFLVAIDGKIMLGQTTSRIGRAALLGTFILMASAAVGMIVM